MGQPPWYEFQNGVARYRGDTHGFNTVQSYAALQFLE
jgi:hypothetical protein